MSKKQYKAAQCVEKDSVQNQQSKLHEANMFWPNDYICSQEEQNKNFFFFFFCQTVSNMLVRKMWPDFLI